MTTTTSTTRPRVSVLFHFAHPKADLFERWLLAPFTRFRHCTLRLGKVVVDYNILRPAVYSTETVFAHTPPKAIVKLGRCAVYDVSFVGRSYHRLSYNCIHFIADALGLTLPQTLMTPDGFYRFLVSDDVGGDPWHEGLLPRWWCWGGGLAA